MDGKLENEVYATLLGQYTLHPEYAVPGVPNAFAPESECMRLYDRMDEIRQWLWQRLDAPEDEDVEQLIGCLEMIQHCLCLEMFRQGRRFGPEE